MAHAWSGRSLVLLAFFLLHGAAYGQRPVGTDGAWLTFGLGVVNHPGDDEDFDLHASYSFARRQTAYQLAFDYTGELWGEDHASTLSTGIGRRSHSRYFLMAQFVGPSLTYDVVSVGPYGLEGARRNERRLYPGVTANAQFYAKPLGFVLPEVGVGMEVFGNVNRVRRFYGFRLAVVFHDTR